MKKKYIIIGVTAIALIVLLFPIKKVLFDGGTREYSAILYKIIKYNQLDTIDENGNIIKGRKDTEIKIFPFNFIK